MRLGHCGWGYKVITYNIIIVGGTEICCVEQDIMIEVEISWVS